MAEDDIILVLTKEIFNFFQSPTGKVNSVREQSQNLLNEIAQISPFNQKELKRILNGKKEELLKIPGVCLLISLSKGLEREEKEVFEAKFSPKEFSFKEVFSPFVKVLKRLKINLKGVISKLYFKLKIPRFKLPELRLSSPKFLKIKSFKVKINFRALNKNLILILVLILFLTLGFFIFQKREEQKLKDYQAALEVAQEKVIQAESFLILKETNPQAIQKANALFKEAWEEISPLVKIAPTLPSDLSNQVFSLEESIKKNLYQLNKLTEISEPELVFNFEESEFIPQKMLMVGEALYFFNPYTQNIYRLEGEEEKKIETDQKFNLATVIDSSIIFFQKPDKLIPFKEDRFGEVIFLESPYPDFDFNNFSSYKSNLYFLDKKSGEITKYPYLGDLEWGSPQLWLNSTTEKLIGAKSLAIDGSIWVLEKEKTINRYYGGRYQATLKLDLFPDSKNFSKIFTSPSLFYLYILEPSEKRIIITDKEGRVLEQFQSQAFDNLKDFGISKDGKTIYLLNGSKVYKIEF